MPVSPIAAVESSCDRLKRGNPPSILNATQVRSIAATKNLPNAAITRGSAWAMTLPAMKVPPQNRATMTNFRLSFGPSVEGSLEEWSMGVGGIGSVGAAMSITTMGRGLSSYVGNR
ncbi:hypothetical protein Y048_5990 [Burkholderia pseudomallei MSHR456]|nr:hypothetical protein Y048_5990 [Burkholderia pseudomallei MSHR456]